MKFLRVVLATFISLAGAGHAASASVVDDIVQLNRLDEQLQEIQRFAVAEIENRKDVLAADDFKRLRDALAATFDPTRMHDEMTAVFSEQGEAAKLEQWRDQLRSPLMTEMRTLEQASSTEEAFQATLEFGRDLDKSPPSDDRVALVQELASATSAIDLALDSHIAVTRALLRNINPTLPENKRVDARNETRILQELRSQLGEQMRDVAIVTYLYTYRDVSDAKLREYLALYQTDLGRWATELTARSVRKALQMALQEPDR